MQINNLHGWSLQPGLFSCWLPSASWLFLATAVRAAFGGEGILHAAILGAITAESRARINEGKTTMTPGRVYFGMTLCTMTCVSRSRARSGGCCLTAQLGPPHRAGRP